MYIVDIYIYYNIYIRVYVCTVYHKGHPGASSLRPCRQREIGLGALGEQMHNQDFLCLTHCCGCSRNSYFIKTTRVQSGYAPFLPLTIVKNAATVRMGETIHNPLCVDLGNLISTLAELGPIILGSLHKPWMKPSGAIGV